MEAVAAITERRSVRRFANNEVSRDLIREIVDVARFYPSWKNSQSARFYIVDDKDKKAKIATEATLGLGHNEKIISGCPALLVLTIKKGLSGTGANGEYVTSKNESWEVFDSGIAAQTFCLAAVDKGIGTVILGVFKEEVVAQICDIPDDEQVSALIALGYPEDDAKKSGVRKDVNEILFFI